jgi:hypothetical protein
MSAAPALDRERYRVEGYLCPLPALGPEDTARFRAAALGLVERDGRILPGERMNVHLRYKWAADLVQVPAVLDAVSQLLGNDLLVWRATLFFKPSRDTAFVAWHQDAAYWDLEGDDVATAWIALTDSTEANGCVRVVPGTHRAPLLPHAARADRDNELVRGQAIASGVDEAAARSLVLQAGQFSIHHVGIVHGSKPNPSDAPRLGFAVRYVAPHVKAKRVRHSATLVRGRDDCGHFELVPLPRYEGDPIARAASRRATRVFLRQFASQLWEEPLRASLTTALRLARRGSTWRGLWRYLAPR